MDEAAFAQATTRGNRARHADPHAVSARYLPGRGRLVITLSTGAELSVATNDIEGLAGALADDLRVIEVSPAGTGLHFPRLNADVYVPGLIAGVMGSARWMAEHKSHASRGHGAPGGRRRSRAAESAP